MNTITFKKRIEKEAYSKNGKLLVKYEKVLNLLKNMLKGDKVFPYRWARKGSRYTLTGVNHVDNLQYLCVLLRVELTSGNSGKGGKEKEYFFLKRSEINKLKTVNFNEL